MTPRNVPCGVNVPTCNFEKDAFVPRPAHPPRACQSKAGIDHLARPVHVVGLKARGRIGHFDLAVDAETIAMRRARRPATVELEPAIVRAAHLVGLVRRMRSTRRAPGAQRRKMTLSGVISGPNGLASIMACPRRPGSKPAGAISLAPGVSVVCSASTELAAVSSTRDQPATFGHGGKVTSTPFVGGVEHDEQRLAAVLRRGRAHRPGSALRENSSPRPSSRRRRA